MPKDTIVKATAGSPSAEYAAFLETKVAIARQSVASGKGRLNDDVEASFSALRRQIEDANR
ncbi:hypothetical protein QTL95_12840 [Rhizobium sp. S152]|uniref:hypothetical protein n=1 Tax=Rhizobium sp. S152 TaxID=3055038 RepID=UPI0025A95575|nr:hypothetical protein [Rhizobium sp. S152]MDM9626789.1 hypothetical protein [Rhizobium sp. S152]